MKKPPTSVNNHDGPDEQSVPYKDQYLRALADYQNLEKRTEERTAEIRRYAAKSVLGDFLVVLDTLEKAEKHLQDAGLSLGVKQFRDTLSRHGVTRMEVTGKLFDPNIMECVETGHGKHLHVISEVLPGYVLGDQVLRIAKVVVGSEPKGNDEGIPEPDKNRSS